MTLEQRAEALLRKWYKDALSDVGQVASDDWDQLQEDIAMELQAVVEACAKAVCMYCNDPAWPLSKEDPSMHIVPHDGSWMYCKAQQIRQEVGR